MSAEQVIERIRLYVDEQTSSLSPESQEQVLEDLISDFQDRLETVREEIATDEESDDEDFEDDEDEDPDDE